MATTTKASNSAQASPATPTRSQALYRKYRPTRLEDVVGQEEITTVLRNSIQREQISHAYLFIGPRGTGKTSVARILAHLVNDFPYEIEDDYLDIIEIDAASNTGVDNIRDLREKAIIAPSTGKYKVYIIDEVHMLSRSAANALLKTLEEPPEHVIFILATTDAHKVPITISSRAQLYTFKLAAPEVMQQHLRRIADNENIKITDDALKIVVRRGGGSFRDSLSLLDQVAKLSDSEITEEDLIKALGLPQEQAVSQLLQGYISGDTATIHTTLKNLLNTGVKPEVVAQEAIARIVDQPQRELLPLLSQLTEVRDPYPEVKLLLAFLGYNVEGTGVGVGNVSRARGIASGSRNSVSTAASSIPPSHPTPGAKPLKTPPERSEGVVPPENMSISDEKSSTKTAVSEPGDSATEDEGTGSVVKDRGAASAGEDGGTTSTRGATSAEGARNASDTVAPRSAPTGNFSWEGFLEGVQGANLAVYTQLKHTSHEIQGDTLHLYPEKRIVKDILNNTNNRELLARFLQGMELVVHDAGNTPPPKDPQISKISDIMGGIQEIDEEMPF